GVGERALNGFDCGACLVGFGGATGAGIHVPDVVRDARRSGNLAEPSAVHIPSNRQALGTLYYGADTLIETHRFKQWQQEGVLGQVEIRGRTVFRFRGFHAPAPTSDVLPGEKAGPNLIV